MIAIRRGTIDDAPLLAQLTADVQALHARAHPEVFKQPPDLEGLVLHYQEQLQESATHIFIGEIAGRAVGCVVAKIMRRPENPFTYAMESVFVDHLCVVDGEQGQGYGSALMQAVYELARAESINEVRLDVWSFNAQALRFYQKQGFAPYRQMLALSLD